MSPSEFRTAFRNRLLIPHPQLLAHTTCACAQDVDVLGVHTQKCRLDGNLTNSTNNRLVACIAEIIRSCGQSVRVEVTGIFNNVDPTSHQRMDLVVYDSGRVRCSGYQSYHKGGPTAIFGQLGLNSGQKRRGIESQQQKQV